MAHKTSDLVTALKPLLESRKVSYTYKPPTNEEYIKLRLLNNWIGILTIEGIRLIKEDQPRIWILHTGKSLEEFVELVRRRIEPAQ